MATEEIENLNEGETMKGGLLKKQKLEGAPRNRKTDMQTNGERNRKRNSGTPRI